jgi:transcriptional regulator with XRE-family HTH domain
MSQLIKRRTSIMDRVIGRNLRRIRKARGLSQQTLAATLGVSFQQIQKYEKGQNRLPVSRLYCLQKIYGIPFGDFFDGLERIGKKDMC